MSALRTVCSWCGVVLQDGPPEPVSHGCCKACAAGLMAEMRARREVESFVQSPTQGWSDPATGFFRAFPSKETR